ncbi:MAG: hypothetical protein ACOY94_04455 [Bacillota bacterium]
MLDVLIRLMEEGDFKKCLRLAEQLMLKGGWSLSEMATINLAICRCRLGINDPYGAIAAGMLAVKLAKDTGEYDLLGRSLLNLGTAYVGIRQYDQALQQFYSYLEFRPEYKEARRLEGAIWRHIGVTHQRKLESQKAVEALTRARDWFSDQGIDYSTFTCNHDLINTYLQMHETDTVSTLEPVKDLLLHQKLIANRNRRDTYYQGTYLLDVAATYLAEGRIGRAMVAANKGLEVHRGDRIHAFHCQMVLYKCSIERGDPRRALGHALAARVQAVEGRFYELEFLSSQAMADVIKQQGPEMVRQLDEEYLAMGVDLGQYLSPWVLRRETQ